MQVRFRSLVLAVSGTLAFLALDLLPPGGIDLGVDFSAALANPGNGASHGGGSAGGGGRGNGGNKASGSVDLWTATLAEGGGLKSGTSDAVPFVSAAAAVLRALHPELTANDVKSTLYGSARDLGDRGHDPVFGWGLVQAGPLCGSPADPSVMRSSAGPDSVGVAEQWRATS